MEGRKGYKKQLYGYILAKIFVIELGAICDLCVVKKGAAIESRPLKIVVQFL